MINSIAVLGGGSAGFIAAITLKKRIPDLEVSLVHSPDIGIIGVGEGTTINFNAHFFGYLGFHPRHFFKEAEPTWKMGLRFDWGSRGTFHYPFTAELDFVYDDLERPLGYYYDDETSWTGVASACMARGRAFVPDAKGKPDVRMPHGYHIENIKLVGWLTGTAEKLGVKLIEGEVEGVERKGQGLSALALADGRKIAADLFVDASGFRSELISKQIGEPWSEYRESLFCDRAVIGGWPRTDEPIKPYTTCENMDAGWCWQIEHENWINRGYVYGSAFISDEDALAEFTSKNPKIANEPRVVRFRSGRVRRHWVDNVFAIGNASGFVEPLEATALQIICLQSLRLTETLRATDRSPGEAARNLCNRILAEYWDETRDFLAIHYAFNRRLDTPFWKACREDTDLKGARPLVDFYRENGPSLMPGGQLTGVNNSFGMEGYLQLLLGQDAPYQRRFEPSDKERQAAKRILAVAEKKASQALTIRESLDAVRGPGWKWPEFPKVRVGS